VAVTRSSYPLVLVRQPPGTANVGPVPLPPRGRSTAHGRVERTDTSHCRSPVHATIHNAVLQKAGKLMAIDERRMEFHRLTVTELKNVSRAVLHGP
jgi:hypothetical protein